MNENLSPITHAVSFGRRRHVRMGYGLLLAALACLLCLVPRTALAAAPNEQTGGLVLLAGTIDQTGSADGTDASAQFNRPMSVAVDAHGNVYVADGGNDTIRKVTPQGVVTTLAGAAGQAGSRDGTGAAARFNLPMGVAVAANGDVYVADTGNDTIRKITPDGVVTTLAGKAGHTGTTNGSGAVARFDRPTGIDVGPDGAIYVADTWNDTIRKITPQGQVSTFAGAARAQGAADGNATSARFYSPDAVAVDRHGNVYVADAGNVTIRRITPDGEVSTVAGKTGESGTADGQGAQARFYFLTGIAVGAVGNVYVSDMGGNTIRKVTPQGEVTTVVGDPARDNTVLGPLPGALNEPASVAITPSGALVIADQQSVLVVATRRHGFH